MIILSGFLLGFLGSLHCVGMCGPIVLAMPRGNNGFFGSLLQRIVYHIGRIFTYMILGAIFGVIGDKIKMMTYQQEISVILGAFILIFALASLFNVQLVKRFTFLEKVYSSLRVALGSFITRKGFFAQFILGFLNGLLPCGFVYVGIAGATAIGNPVQSTLFMVLFGLGTAPALIIVALIPGALKLNKLPVRKLIPIFSILFAVLIIARGLNLGIPYISPKVHKTEAKQIPVQTQPAQVDTTQATEKESGSCCGE
ncbi:MAG: sulfite exporter TauE/SafE family protein [Ignavibacteria bacterium]|nr:sulfite exporter TauE/SafE family protein [Ignavibacteria bacterium]